MNKGRSKSLTVFLKLFGLYACAGLASYAIVLWAPTLLSRLYGISAAHSGLLVGPVFAAGGVAGSIFGGIHADRLVARGWLDGRIRVNVFAFPIFIVAVILSGLTIALWVSLAGIFLALFATSYSLAVGYSAVQELAPNRLRGQIVAVYSMNFNLIGLSAGPTAVAMANDYLFRRDSAIGNSMILVCVPALCLGLILTLATLRDYRRVRGQALGD
jgi:MFS family permease